MDDPGNLTTKPSEMTLSKGEMAYIGFFLVLVVCALLQANESAHSPHKCDHKTQCDDWWCNSVALRN